MVTTVGEVRAAREIYERVARRLRRRGERIPEKLPPLGIMIETPGAALSADALALEADFFAIGTNDLTAYTLAVDRGESDVAELYDPMHPAVLRLVQFATEAALRMRMPVSVCGEMAAIAAADAAAAGAGAAVVQHERRGGAAGEAGDAVGGDRCLRAVRPAGDGAIGPGADRRAGAGVRAGGRGPIRARWKCSQTFHCQWNRRNNLSLRGAKRRSDPLPTSVPPLVRQGIASAPRASQ